jgi:hypothetical protein
MREVNEIAGKRYRTRFERLALAEDRNRASAQMRHIVGVTLKRAHSDEIIKLSEEMAKCATIAGRSVPKAQSHAGWRLAV